MSSSLLPTINRANLRHCLLCARYIFVMLEESTSISTHNPRAQNSPTTRFSTTLILIERGVNKKMGGNQNTFLRVPVHCIIAVRICRLLVCKTTFVGSFLASEAPRRPSPPPSRRSRNFRFDKREVAFPTATGTHEGLPRVCLQWGLLEAEPPTR